MCATGRKEPFNNNSNHRLHRGLILPTVAADAGQ